MDMQTVWRTALEVYRQYNPESLVPFPFQEMVNQLGDVDVIFLDTIQPDVSGAVYFQNKQFTIIINSQKPEARQYFTIAHEFGHYFLHGDWLRENGENGFVDFSETLEGQGMLLRPDELSPISIDRQKEREANNFAAELVMPSNKVRAYWDLTHDIVQCANAFQVSKSAMAVRLERLGLA